jgi:hypothetical protein
MKESERLYQLRGFLRPLNFIVKCSYLMIPSICHEMI